MKKIGAGNLVTMGIGALIFILGVLKEAIENKEQEHLIEELVEEKVNEKLGEPNKKS